MSSEDHEVIEETFENRPLGLEEEQDPDQAAIAKPWRPEDIRVSTKQFSLRNILDLIAEGDLELAPDFQRNSVWKPLQKSRLIESILLQIPLPAFYFAEDSNGMITRRSSCMSSIRQPRPASNMTSSNASIPEGRR